jgi:hypothetical protein
MKSGLAMQASAIVISGEGLRGSAVGLLVHGVVIR